MAVLINLVCTVITIVLGIVFGIIVVANVGIFFPELANDCAEMASLQRLGVECDQVKTPTMVLTGGVLFLTSCVSIYLWICNFSLYKELKQGNGNPQQYKQTPEANTEMI